MSWNLMVLVMINCGRNSAIHIYLLWLIMVIHYSLSTMVVSGY